MFFLSLISTEKQFFEYNFQRSSGNSSPQHMLDFTQIDKFSTHFSKCPVSFPIILVVTNSKIGKHMGTLGKFSTYFMVFNICFGPKLHFVSL